MFQVEHTSQPGLPFSGCKTFSSFKVPLTLTAEAKRICKQFAQNESEIPDYINSPQNKKNLSQNVINNDMTLSQVRAQDNHLGPDFESTSRSSSGR